MPAAGGLRHRVRIEARNPGTTALGAPVDSWSAVMTVWASVDDRRGREFVTAGAGAQETQAIVNEVTTELRVRYRAGIRPEMRAVDVCPSSAGCSGRSFDITSVRDPRGRRRELVLEAWERRVEAD